jgi:TrpR-related protein YerC/YecD
VWRTTDAVRPAVGLSAAERRVNEPEAWRTPSTDALFDAVLALEDRAEAEHFFRDLCTLRELRDLAQRWEIARLLDEGLHYTEISQRTGASTATITRIAQWLHHGTGGYRLALARLGGDRTEPKAEGAS